MKLFLILVSSAIEDYITSILVVSGNEIEARAKVILKLNKGEFIECVEEVNEIDGFKVVLNQTVG